MDTKKVTIVFGIIILIVVCVLFLFASPQIASHEQKIVTLGSNSKTIGYTPVYVALEKGWFAEVFKKYDFNYSFVEFGSTPSINEAFAAKKLDIVAEAEIPASVGRAGGLDITIQALDGSYYQELVVPKNSTIESYSDLKGKNVAVQSGTSSHYSLSKMLEQSSLAMSDVSMIDLAPMDGQAAFDSGKVDAWAVWPPFVEKEQLSNNVRTIKGKDILSIIAFRGEFAKQNPEFTKEFLAVIKKAKDWVVANPAEAQQIVSKRLNLDLNVVKLDWPKNDFSKDLSSADVSDIQAKADFLYQIKLVKNQINAKDFVVLTN